MKKIANILVFFLLIIEFGCSEKAEEIRTLQLELEQISYSDQYNRSISDSLVELYGWNSPQLDSLWRQQLEFDSINTKRICQIIDSIGYPGKSVVGEELSNVAFLVIQHANLEVQKKYFQLLKRASNKNELSKSSVAMLEDRILMYEGKPQIYGTQLKGDRFFDSIRNEYIDTLFLWTLRSPDSVDVLRKKVGIESTIEEYVKQFGLEYHS